MKNWPNELNIKGKSTNGQQQNNNKIHEEMLNVPGYKGNANQNHIKNPFHSCYNGYLQEHKQ
jgi:hypothetical protein